MTSLPNCYRCGKPVTPCGECGCEDGICLIHADCRNVLPLLEPGSVDLVLTDPPYGQQELLPETASTNRNGKNMPRLSRKWGKQRWDIRPDKETLDCVRAVGRFAIIWGGNYFGLPPAPCWLVWRKMNPAPDFADCELAWTNLPCAVREFSYRQTAKQYHPTEKPLLLIVWAIEAADKAIRRRVAQKRESSITLILDPFAGSGTTGRVCKDLGRKCIMVEIELKYVEIAANRLRQEVLF